MPSCPHALMPYRCGSGLCIDIADGIGIGMGRVMHRYCRSKNIQRQSVISGLENSHLTRMRLLSGFRARVGVGVEVGMGIVLDAGA